MKLIKRIKKLFRRKRKSSNYPSYRAVHQPSRFKKLIKKTFAFGIGAAALLLLWCYITLPSIDNLNKFTKAPSVLIKSEDGKIIGSFGDIYGDYVPFSELPSSLIDAVIATEDRNFYHHFGIDPFGLLRALFADVRAGHIVQGGSTITQQVAKNVFLTPERSLTRKVKEIMLALRLEHRFSKQDIMSIYLNRVYLGAGNYGVDAASRRYFDKSARELTLSESAILAGLLKAPSRFAPTANPILAKKRADQVLINMQEAGFLDERQTARARDELAKSMSARKAYPRSTQYFADWIMDQLPEYIGNIQEDLVVTTTLNPDMQLMAETAVGEVMDKEGPAHDAGQAALLSMTPDGAVKAMIGGRSYGESQFNRATQAQRQPGSAFKLFVYLAGLEAGLTPDTPVDDRPFSVPIAGGVWEPHNYTNKYLGTMPLRDAVAESVNTVAVQVALRVGIENVIAIAHRLGITSEMEAVPAIALGATEVTLLELTNAYAHLAAGGMLVYPYGIVAIDTVHGDAVYRRQATGGVVLRPNIVGEMNELLLGVVEHGTGRAAKIGRPIAGKTGTTSDYRDAWFIGFAPQLVTGVWVGNDNNAPMVKVTGGMLPAAIWHRFMQQALAKTPVADIPTSGNAFVSLPWQEGIPEYPEQPGPDRFHHSEHSVTLGHSFWDKLFGHH